MIDRTWKINYTNRALKQFSQIDRPIQKEIQKFLNEKLLVAHQPTEYGKALTGKFKTFWSYRVGQYRIISKHKNGEMIVLIVKVGHRRNVYRDTR